MKLWFIHFSRKVLMCTFVLFMLAPMIGTVSHEFGHWGVGKVLGLNPKLHFASCTYHPHLRRFVHPSHEEGSVSSRNGLKDIGRSVVDSGDLDWNGFAVKKIDAFWVALSGPMVTILVGLLGFLICMRTSPKNNVRWLDAFVAMLCLFWIRGIVVLMAYVLVGSHLWQDETVCAFLLGMDPKWFIVPLGLLGLALSGVCIWKWPAKSRKDFVLGVAAGSFCGSLLWFIVLGPKLLP